jgi:hypothetical protein
MSKKGMRTSPRHGGSYITYFIPKPTGPTGPKHGSLPPAASEGKSRREKNHEAAQNKGDSKSSEYIQRVRDRVAARRAAANEAASK